MERTEYNPITPTKTKDSLFIQDIIDSELQNRVNFVPHPTEPATISDDTHVNIVYT